MIGIARIANPHGATREQIRNLLSHAGLPLVGLEETEFYGHFGARGELVGVVGMEKWNRMGLLRSLAVWQQYRGKGIGRTLVKHILASLEGSVEEVYLFTENAEEFFRGLGFAQIPLSRVPRQILSSALVSRHCLERAAPMLIRLREKREDSRG